MLSFAIRSAAISLSIGVIAAGALWLLRSEPADLMIRRVAVRTRHMLPNPGPAGERPPRVSAEGYRLAPIGESFRSAGAVVSWLVRVFFSSVPLIAGGAALSAAGVGAYHLWGRPVLRPVGESGAWSSLFFSAVPWCVLALAGLLVISDTLWRVSWYANLAAYPMPYAENSRAAVWVVRVGVLILAGAAAAYGVVAAADRQAIGTSWSWCASCGFVPPAGAERCPECGALVSEGRGPARMIAGLQGRSRAGVISTGLAVGVMCLLAPWTMAWGRVAVQGKALQAGPPGRTTTPLEELRAAELRSRPAPAVP